jgi:hemin uptake protein HemP
MTRMMIKQAPITQKVSSTTTSSLQSVQARGDELNFRISSDEILRGQREVEVEHRGMVYRLRCTSLGKLILTK